jgi:hypothetical protein
MRRAQDTAGGKRRIKTSADLDRSKQTSPEHSTQKQTLRALDTLSSMMDHIDSNEPSVLSFSEEHIVMSNVEHMHADCPNVTRSERAFLRQLSKSYREYHESNPEAAGALNVTGP